MSQSPVPLKPAAIYLSLSTSQSIDDPFLWALYVSCTSSGSEGTLFHAVAVSTVSVPRYTLFKYGAAHFSHRFVFESKQIDVYQDPHLFLLLELGILGDRYTVGDLHAILEKVVIPPPEDKHSHLFNGRVWVIKAIMRLAAYGILQFWSLQQMEDEFHRIAARAWNGRTEEQGWTVAKIFDY
ncbi:hypothetical protein M422DRAFT_26768 [Sphaerobolus stellatus SS14]|nr:hypothetical protein M422DRAFT_26768 [Sphaerobolus stellatus SS14]